VPKTGDTGLDEAIGYHGFPELATTGETGLDEATTGFTGTLERVDADGFGFVTVTTWETVVVTEDVDTPVVVYVLLELTYVDVNGHGDGVTVV
jgi:hypothetical protein